MYFKKVKAPFSSIIKQGWQDLKDGMVIKIKSDTILSIVAGPLIVVHVDIIITYVFIFIVISIILNT